MMGRIDAVTTLCCAAALGVAMTVVVDSGDEALGDEVIAEQRAALAAVDRVDGFHQAVNLWTDLGTAVEYAGSTTGPGDNTTGSPFQVSWSVHPQVKKVNIASVARWLNENPFDEDHAHGVRNLVVNPDLLSPIGG